MSKEELNCSFCGRAKPQTQLLIAGLDAHIVISVFFKPMELSKKKPMTKNQNVSLMWNLFPPKKIKSF